MPSPLISFLQGSNNCFIADLFTISLVNGQVISATSGQEDITLQLPTPYFSQAPNMVPDPNGTRGTWTTDASLAYSPTGGAVSGGKWTYTGTGSASGFHTVSAMAVQVVPGTTYIVSAYIDATHATSGGPGIAFENLSNTTGVNKSQTAGVNGRVYATFTAPAGMTLMHVFFDTNNCTVASGQPLTLSNPQLEPASFYAAKYGKWSRAAITSSAGFDLTPNTVDIKFMENTADQGGPVVFPGSNATMLQAIAGKLFLPANVGIYAAYMPTYGDISLGTETKFIGDIIKSNAVTRTSTTFTAYDLAWRLDQQSPPGLYQPGCRHTVFDANCTLSAAAFTTSARTVQSGSTSTVINLSPALPSIGSNSLPYTLGVLTWASGNNAGLSNKVKMQNSTTQLTLDLPTFMPVVAGDTFTLTPGCDQTFNTCLNTYSNTINYGGERFMPPGEVAL